MKLSVGGDHAGFPLKATIIKLRRSVGHDVTDRGCHDESPVDFPDITRMVCASVEPDKVSVMCIGAQVVGPWLAEELVRIAISAQPSAPTEIAGGVSPS